jgi:hypothetical protein
VRPDRGACGADVGEGRARSPSLARGGEEPRGGDRPGGRWQGATRAAADLLARIPGREPCGPFGLRQPATPRAPGRRAPVRRAGLVDFEPGMMDAPRALRPLLEAVGVGVCGPLIPMRRRLAPAHREPNVFRRRAPGRGSAAARRSAVLEGVGLSTRTAGGSATAPHPFARAFAAATNPDHHRATTCTTSRDAAVSAACNEFRPRPVRGGRASRTGADGDGRLRRPVIPRAVPRVAEPAVGEHRRRAAPAVLRVGAPRPDATLPGLAPVDGDAL